MPRTATQPRVFVARRIPAEGLDLLGDAAMVDLWDSDLPPMRADLLAHVQGADGLLSLLTDRVDDELLDAAGPGLKVVANLAVGFDNIDVPACTRRGIPVGNTPGVLTETTADLAFALMMAAARRLKEGIDYVEEDRWQTWGPLLLLGVDVHHATLGIVGFGRIGRELARRAAGFSMRVLYHDVERVPEDVEREFGATFASLDELLSQSDFVSLHVNLTPQTRHLIDAEALAKMKPTAVLVNTSRGPVVDQKALYAALRAGRIFAAGLDVTDPEPMRADEPLLTLPNCIVVPHVASATTVTRGKMARIAAENVLAGLRGERLPACVNPEVYERAS
jgi:lactate dehydrogenase-like 2-hydroxyacid dehydrogenase